MLLAFFKFYDQYLTEPKFAFLCFDGYLDPWNWYEFILVFFNQNTLLIADKMIMPPLAKHQLDMSASTIVIKIFDFTRSTPSF